MNWSQVVGIEYQAVAVAAPPATAALVGWLLRLVQGHVRGATAERYVGRLVAWAEQAIPNKSQRYVEVASLLSQRFPGLSALEVEVLIESEVQALKAGLSPLAGAVPGGAAAAAGTVAVPGVGDAGPGGSVSAAAPGGLAAVGPVATPSAVVTTGGQG